MAIDFSKDRWQEIKETYSRWWAGDLKRPLINFSLSGRDPGRAEPKLPNKGFTAHYGLDISPESVVDRWDYNLSCHKYVGDGFPSVWPNFGPGVAAAFSGAELFNDENTVWFHPRRELAARDVHLELNTEERWFRHIAAICRAAMQRWQGLVQVGMTDLGGNLDIVSTFLPSERLLLDLYDNPGEVKRLAWESHELWWHSFAELNRCLQPINPGYTGWTPIYSAEPYYMLQCDFCYMIGPDMFDEFVRPELAATCQRLVNAFYHLDGKGELPHLDSLLRIKELKGVQWVPGDGMPDITHWPEVYKKIRKAGKFIQIFGGPRELDALADQLGTAEGIVLIGSGDIKDEKEIRTWLKKYGAA
jgi:5-methyltetrahydrofolate--homocysteine methyltransferase